MSAITIQRIERLDLFRDCQRSQLVMIDQLLTTLTFRAGRTICLEGEPGSEFFVLIDGLVQVQHSTGSLALLHPGAWFGETALIHQTTQPAAVTTVVDSMLILFNRAEFNTLLHIAPRVRDRLDLTAALGFRGGAPTSQPWYQPINPTSSNQSPTAIEEPTAP